MIKVRTMAGAILAKDDRFLLMKRSDTRAFYPGVWGAVGGHLTPGEIDDPRAACLREIREETGLTGDDIEALDLRYITLRRHGDEIRMMYVYAGTARTFAYEDKTDEGTLHWIQKDAVLDRELSYVMRQVLERYLRYEDGAILVGTLRAEGGIPCLEWSPLDHWDGL